MADLPEANIAHVSTGRIRVRIPSMRGNGDYFSRVEEFLSPLPGVEKVAVNPLTGSVLVLHSIEVQSADDLKSVAAYSEISGLFKLVVSDLSSAPRAQGIAGFFARLDEKLKVASGGAVDIPSLAVLGLLGMTIVQVSQGAVAVPAVTALWYASSILTYQVSKQQIEAPRAQADVSAYTHVPEAAPTASGNGEQR
jgi:hypothetical protein